MRIIYYTKEEIHTVYGRETFIQRGLCLCFCTTSMQKLLLPPKIEICLCIIQISFKNISIQNYERFYKRYRN